MGRPAVFELLPVVDLRVDLHHAGTRDLETLRRLGTDRVVATWEQGRRRGPPQDPEAFLERAVTEGVSRLAAAGLGGGLCLGIDPDQVPARGRERLLARLPSFLGAPGVLGIGPLTPTLASPVKRRVFEGQLSLAAQLRRPVILRLSARGQAMALSTIVSATRSAGLSPGSVLVQGGTPRSLKILHALGYCCGLDTIAPEVAAPLASSLGAGALVLGSGLGAGPVDFLAPHRTLLLAREAGLSPSACRALAGGTASRVFGLSLP